MFRRLTIAALLIGTLLTVFLLLRDDEKTEGDHERSKPDLTVGPSLPSQNAEGPFFAGLDEGKEKFIWDAEHYTFELETHVGRKIAAALKDRDASEIGEVLTENFQGRIVDRSNAKTVTVSGIRDISVESDESSRQTNASEFAAWLTNRFDETDQIQSARFRVLQIRQDDSQYAERWTLECLLTAKAVTSDGRFRYLEQESTLVCRFASDEDIRQLRLVETWNVDSESLRDSRQLMTECTSESGLDQFPIHDNWESQSAPRQYNKQMAVADFDLNGFPDIAVATMDRQILLLANREGRFKDVTAAVKLPTTLESRIPSMLVTWIDFDNDGFQDLLLGDSLYRNLEGTSFRVVADTNLQIGMNPMGSAVADYDADGLLDVYICYQHSAGAKRPAKIGWLDDNEGGARNQLWKNLGNGRFRETTDSAGVSGGLRHSFAAVWLHANDDHWPDLYVANDFAQNTFLLNQGNGTFKDISDVSKTADFATSMGVAAGDLDGDGRTDLYVANMYSKMGRRILAQVSDNDYPAGTYQKLKGACAGNRLYSTTSNDLVYEEFSDAAGINGVGWAYAPALADFNADGQLDIYATAGFMSFRRDKPDG